MILMSDPQNDLMQSYLRTVVVNLDMRQLGGIDPRMLVFVSDRADSHSVPLLAAVFHYTNQAGRSNRVIQ